MRRAAVVLLCLLTVVVAAPAPAYAHGLLVVSTPANGATVTEPPELSLAFTEKPPQFAFFSVTAPGGARVEQPWSHAEPFPLTKPVREYQVVDGVWQPREFTTGFPVRVPVAHWPEHGQYVVRYQSVATDGEEVKGEVRFTYRGSVTTAPPGWQAPASRPGPELLAAVGQPRTGDQPQPASAAPAPAAAPAAAVEEPGRGPWPWLVPLLLVAAAAGLLLLWRTGRRS